MMLPRIIGVVAVATFCLAGCGHPDMLVDTGAPPQCVGGQRFPDDTLSFSVCTLQEKPPAQWRDYDHALSEIRIFADDLPVDIPVTVSDRWGKTGWHELATFDAPKGAKTITAMAYFQHRGKKYHIVVPYVLSDARNEKWRCMDVEINEIKEKKDHCCGL